MDKTFGLNKGERTALMLLLNSFEGDRTSSVMRKTKRIKRAIRHEEIREAPVDVLMADHAEIEATLDTETLGWLWDTFSKFNRWPTQLDEWVETLDDKLRGTLAAKSADS